MAPTKLFEKLAASIANVLVAIVISFPFFVQWGIDNDWKLVTIAIFFFYEMVFIFTPGKRDLGMRIIKSYWQNEPSFARYLLYNLLYYLSFATLFFHIWFPLDLLLLNLLLLQLPIILIKQNTVHGYLSGLITTKKSPNRGLSQNLKANA